MSFTTLPRSRNPDSFVHCCISSIPPDRVQQKWMLNGCWIYEKPTNWLELKKTSVRSSLVCKSYCRIARPTIVRITWGMCVKNEHVLERQQASKCTGIRKKKTPRSRCGWTGWGWRGQTHVVSEKTTRVLGQRCDRQAVEGAFHNCVWLWSEIGGIKQKKKTKRKKGSWTWTAVWWLQG